MLAAPEALAALESGGGEAIMSKGLSEGPGLEEGLEGSSSPIKDKFKGVLRGIGSIGEGAMNVASNTASAIGSVGQDVVDRVDPATNYFTNRDKNKLITQVAELLVSYICNTMISSPGYSNSGANLETKIIGLVETKLHDIFEGDDQNAPDGPEKLKNAIIEGVASIFNKLSGNTVLLYSMILENEETGLISNALTIVFGIAYDKATDPNTPDETGFMQSLFSNSKDNFMASFLSQVMITVQNPIDVLPELQGQQTMQQRGGNVRRTHRQSHMRKKNKTRKSSNKKYHKHMVLRKKSRKYKGNFVKNRKVKSQKIRQVGGTGTVAINADADDATEKAKIYSNDDTSPEAIQHRKAKRTASQNKMGSAIGKGLWNTAKYGIVAPIALTAGAPIALTAGAIALPSYGLYRAGKYGVNKTGQALYASAKEGNDVYQHGLSDYMHRASNARSKNLSDAKNAIVKFASAPEPVVIANPKNIDDLNTNKSVETQKKLKEVNAEIEAHNAAELDPSKHKTLLKSIADLDPKHLTDIDKSFSDAKNKLETNARLAAESHSEMSQRHQTAIADMKTKHNGAISAIDAKIANETDPAKKAQHELEKTNLLKSHNQEHENLLRTHTQELAPKLRDLANAKSALKPKPTPVNEKLTTKNAVLAAKLEANRQQRYRQQQHQSTANQSQGQGQGQSTGQSMGQECVMPDPNAQQYLGEYTEELFEKLSARLNDSENDLLNKILSAVMQILMDSSSPIIAKIAGIVGNVNLPENMGSMSTSILACNLLNAENEVFGNAVKHAYTETYKNMKDQIEGSEKQVSTRFVMNNNFIQTVIEHMRNALHIILYAANE